MTKKTYIPTFAKNMNEVGQYAFKHQVKLLEFIEQDAELTAEERELAKKALSTVIEAYPVFRDYWSRYLHGKI